MSRPLHPVVVVNKTLKYIIIIIIMLKKMGLGVLPVP
jgi:hypothetical protein